MLEKLLCHVEQWRDNDSRWFCSYSTWGSRSHWVSHELFSVLKYSRSKCDLIYLKHKAWSTLGHIISKQEQGTFQLQPSTVSALTSEFMSVKYWLVYILLIACSLFLASSDKTLFVFFVCTFKCCCVALRELVMRYVSAPKPKWTEAMLQRWMSQNSSTLMLKPQNVPLETSMNIQLLKVDLVNHRCLVLSAFSSFA